MAIKLTWSNRAAGDSIRVYRSTTAFTPTTLPISLATLGGGVTTFVDATAAANESYFYAVETIKDDTAMLSALQYITNVAPVAPVGIVERIGTPVESRADLEAMTSGGIYYLTNDIDLTGSNWVPLDTFNGIFDGCGYTISNAVMDQSGIEVGFWRKIENATIMRVRFYNCSSDNHVSTSYNAIVGAWFRRSVAYQVIVDSCHVEISTDRTGGMFGLMDVHGFLNQCLVLNTTRSWAGSSAFRVGAMTGYQAGSGVIDSFYDKTTFVGSPAGQSGPTTAHGKTYAELIDETLYPASKWNRNVWDIVNGSYPTFVESVVHTLVSNRAELEAALYEDSNELIRLTNNIDLSGTPWAYGDGVFSGEIDGDGFSITGLQKLGLPTYGTTTGGGLLHALEWGAVRNLSLDVELEDATVDADASYQGGIAGTGSSIMIDNCVVSGSIISGGARSGGLIGWFSNGSINRCVSKCAVSSGSFEGAVAGQVANTYYGVRNTNITSLSGNTSGTPGPDTATLSTGVGNASHFTARNYPPELWNIDDATEIDFNYRTP